MAKNKAEVIRPVVNTDDSALVAVVEEAKRLTDGVKRLADVSGNNMVAIGLICRQFKISANLYKSLGFNTFESWRIDSFAKKASTAKSSLRIVDSLLPIFTEKELLSLGRVKANAYCKLPESEQRKDSWKIHVFTDDGTTFAARVKSFLAGSDLREDFGKVGFEAPKSFIQETWDRVIARGKIVEGTSDTWPVVEAAMASYDGELGPESGSSTALATLAIHTTVEKKKGIQDAIRLGNLSTGQQDDVTVLTALNILNDLPR